MLRIHLRKLAASTEIEIRELLKILFEADSIDSPEDKRQPPKTS